MLGFSCGLDFETQIVVKRNAPELLRRELASPRWNGEVIAMSGVTDAYQPIEEEHRVTRRCLEVMAECRQPVGIVTKNRLVTRDLDLLVRLAGHDAVSVAISLTTLDADLARRMEPRASAPRDRLRAIRELADAGIPVTVMVAPVIPALTDHEIPALLDAAAEAGARSAAWLLLRLPYQVDTLFLDWLDPAEQLRVRSNHRERLAPRDASPRRRGGDRVFSGPRSHPPGSRGRGGDDRGGARRSARRGRVVRARGVLGRLERPRLGRRRRLLADQAGADSGRQVRAGRRGDRDPISAEGRPSRVGRACMIARNSAETI